MLEKIYAFANGNEKRIEKIIDDQPVMINHMIFPEGEGLKEHYSNSNVYMIVIKGAVTLQLGDQEPHRYEAGQIINIPYHIKMNVNNRDPEILELFVIKAPGPAFYHLDNQ
ncbi:cupin domain-containing protein [uncultured Acetobacterium sp.]|uniref:cupin domain-containing protein n=1 Tax=uncultured Acetobacterium sp. TaxID=217139 RepID=UPI0025DBEE53|nr:cupin domain-containing protein [uncultured Acetobacterium sp.]